MISLVAFHFLIMLDEHNMHDFLPDILFLFCR